VNSHDQYTRHILHEIERNEKPTQRALAAELGIALGLTNLLIRRIVKKGWVKVVNVNPRRVRYLITPAGIAAKARITRAYLDNTVHLYTETRERIGASLQALSQEWVMDAGQDPLKRIVFYGAGEVAEIAYISLQRTDLRLIGVVDDNARGGFFGVRVHPSSALGPADLDGQPFGRLVVTSFRRSAPIRARLSVLGIPPERIYWL
jgi:DNA-binding MarR family transcriptional regulator